MQTEQVIILARKHLGGALESSSARLCLADAIALQDKGDLDAARKRAVESLRYSVGVFHPDFKRVTK